MTKPIGLVLTGLFVAAYSMPNADQAPPAAGVTVLRRRAAHRGRRQRADRERRVHRRRQRASRRSAGRRGAGAGGRGRVDLAGKTVMPAIIDTHTHLARDARGARRSPAAQAVLRRRRGDEPGPGHGRRAVPGAGRDDPRTRRASAPPAAGSRCRSRAARTSRTGSPPKPKRGRPCRSTPPGRSTSSRSGSTTATACSRS